MKLNSLKFYFGLFMLLSLFIYYPKVSLAEKGKSQIWLGFVGPGQSTALLGHAFILVSKTNQSVFNSTAYNYGLLISAQSGDPLAEVLRYQIGLSDKVKFKPEKISFSDLYSIYSVSENRTITIVELSLTADEASKLIQTLEADMNDPLFPEREKYELVSNNCLTYVIKLINKNVDQEKQIQMSGVAELFSPTIDFLKNPSYSLFSRFPLFLSRHLFSQPISTGKVEYFASRSQKENQFYRSEFQATFERLAQCISWDSKTTELIEKMLMLQKNLKNGQSVEFISQLINSKEKCSENVTLWKRFLTNYNNIIPQSKLEFKRRIYQLKNELQ
jgi:hypothetical protein